MEAVIGLLVMILGVSHGVETYCDGRQDGAQCYGALGGTVVLQLMDNASEIFRYIWSTKTTIKANTTTTTTTILSWRNNMIVINAIANRSFFTPSDGTFRINNLSWTDGGEYTLQIYASDGQVSERRTLQLTIQGFIFINCTLTNGMHISQWVFAANNTLCVPPTTAPTTRTDTSTVGYLPIMAGVLSALVILLVVGVAVICAQKKKQNNKPKEEEDHELTYADVRMVQQPVRQMQKKAETEVEVEYGQIKFPERPQQTVEPA
ncbi:uncharacterized protein LOC144524450 isoform X2 [Sander vitreus]